LTSKARAKSRLQQLSGVRQPSAPRSSTSTKLYH